MCVQRGVSKLAKYRAAEDTRNREPAGRSLYRVAVWRKVRAPQDRAPGNTWAAQADGKCHRKHTAQVRKNRQG